jgi:DNA-binding GntR family transcriptional regulator
MDLRQGHLWLLSLSKCPRHCRVRLKPLEADSLMSLAYESIRESIIDGRDRTGEHIVESTVANELQISRAPVREALKRLTQEGLAVEHPRRGTFVREITAQDFIDIYNVRIALETAAMRLAVRNCARLDGIERTIARMGKSASRGDVARTVALELQVHQKICEAAGNGYLLSVFQSLLGPVHLALGLDDSAYENLEDVTTEHLALLEALRSGDAEVAADAMHQHIVSTVGPVLERLGVIPPSFCSATALRVKLDHPARPLARRTATSGSPPWGRSRSASCRGARRERAESLFAWLRTLAVREAIRLDQQDGVHLDPAPVVELVLEPRGTFEGELPAAHLALIAVPVLGVRPVVAEEDDPELPRPSES